MSQSDLAPHKDEIAQAARELMRERGYADAITLGTGDLAKVKTRFTAATSLIARHVP